MALATLTPSVTVSTTDPQSSVLLIRSWRGHTLGDLGGTVGGLDQDIATLGSKSRSDGLGKSVDTLEELGTSLNAELELLERCEQASRQCHRELQQSSSMQKLRDIPCEQNAAAAG